MRPFPAFDPMSLLRPRGPRGTQDVAKMHAVWQQLQASPLFQSPWTEENDITLVVDFVERALGRLLPPTSEVGGGSDD